MKEANKEKVTPSEGQLISIGEAKRLLGVHIDTLRKWDKTGRLKAVRIGDKKGWRRYRLSDIERILKGQ